MQETASKVKQRFAADVEGASQARRWLMDWLRGHKLDGPLIAAFGASLSEIANNVIHHANPAPTMLLLDCERRPGEVCVELVTDTNSFKHLADLKQHVRQPDQLDPAAEGGRGLYVLLNYFPDLEYAPADRRGHERYRLRRKI